MKAIAENLINNLDCPYMQQIRDAKPAIAYRECDSMKKSNGRTVHADCEKVKPSNKQYMNYDYIITTYPRNCVTMTEVQFEILIYHELLHIQCYRMSDGQLDCKIRAHDIQDFTRITQQYGEFWSYPDVNVKSLFDVYGSIEKEEEEDV